MVCAACCHLALVFAVMHLYNILLLLSIPFLIPFKNLVLINQQNGLQYLCVLALCAFLTGAIPKVLILRKLGLCMYVLFCMDLSQDQFCRFWRICGLMTCVQNNYEID